MKAQLASVVHDHDGATRHFAAGAGRGGDRDQRQHRLGDARAAALDRGVVLEGARMAPQDSHALGQVHAGAAADRDQAVATLFFQHSEGRTHARLGGVALGAIEDRIRQVPERSLGLGQQAGGAHARIGDDQRAGDADTLALGGQHADGAEIKVDVGQVAYEGHGQKRVNGWRMPASTAQDKLWPAQVKASLFLTEPKYYFVYRRGNPRMPSIGQEGLHEIQTYCARH